MQQSDLNSRFPLPNSLITPSASPPPRYGSVQQQYPRPPAMNAPPLKRQRVSSTPRRTLHDPSPASTSSRSQPPIDIEKEREASRLRLFSAWENLTRLVRPLDEDDIINIRTGKITRDNGVLRNTPRINFGNMLSPADNEGGDEDTDSGEDGEDELDTLSERPLDLDDATQIDFDGGPKVLPPVTPLDPQDNEDLQEFLKAEQQRKALCGSEPETEEEEDEEEDEEEENDGNLAQVDVRDEEIDIGVRDESRGRGLTDELYREEDSQAPSSPALSSDAGVGFSDDELDNWNVDDASFVQPVAKSEDEGPQVLASDSDSDSEIEIIEGPYVQSSPIRPTIPRSKHQMAPIKSKSESPQKKNHTLTQYLTPPHSSSSVNRSDSLGQPESQQQDASPVIDSDFQPSTSSSTQAPSNSHHMNFSRLNKATKSSFRPMDILETTSKANTPSSFRSKPLKLKPIVLLTPRKPSLSTLGTDTEAPPLKADWKGKQKASPPSSPREKRRSDDSKHSPQKLDNPPPPPPIKHDSHRKKLPRYPSAPRDIGRPSSPQDDNSKPVHTHNSSSYDQSSDAEVSKSPRKRKRRSSSGDPNRIAQKYVSSESGMQTPRADMKSADLSIKEGVSFPSHEKRHSHRRKGKNRCSGSDSDSASSTSERAHPRRTPTMSRPRTPTHVHQPSLYFTDNYSSRNSLPPFGPIPDPRAQFIITQAMQQLSALVTGGWAPPQHYDGATPSTYYPDPRYPNPYVTPTHRRPSGYNSNFSNATLPPDSPEPSPEKSSTGRRKSLVRRSRSRGRRVSFHFDGKIASTGKSPSPPVEDDLDSSPTKRAHERSQKRGTPFSGKGKARETTYESSENSEIESDGPSTYVRGQTPGPSWQPGEREYAKIRHSSHKSKS
ncbi:hypothetical protein CVT24_007285 [Panaeolus cyanescens]|uniref:Uncharacterized protein n=1 Tax=Panaeolus cyanescens TaxID=181874 RepID=A0A409VJ72_9AGAR|nr:hypothetical protein CVT24_007285 [Panaeolus cyanescens]